MYFRQIRDKFMLHKRNVLQYVFGWPGSPGEIFRMENGCELRGGW